MNRSEIIQFARDESENEDTDYWQSLLEIADERKQGESDEDPLWSEQ